MPTTSDDVRAAAEAYSAAQAVTDATREALNEAIRQASADGVSLRDLIAATGLSQQRIYQIRHHTR